MEKMRYKFIIQRISLVILSLILGVILIEIGLRTGEFIFLSLQDYRNKISLQRKDTFRIMCIGESTTALGGDSSYPRQLERILNSRGIGVEFSVINEGKVGINVESIVLNLKDKLDRYEPDMVISMIGIMDGLCKIHRDASYSRLRNRKEDSFLKNFKTYNLFKLLKINLIYKFQRKNDNLEMKHEKTNAYEEKYMQAESLVESKSQNRISDYKKGNLCCEQANLKKRINLNSDEYYSYIERGLSYLAQNNAKMARKMYQKAIEINPQAPKAYGHFGDLFFNIKEYFKAEKFLNKAIKLDPGFSYFPYARLAATYLEKGKEEKAEQTLLKGIKYFPESVVLLGMLSVLCEEEGKSDLAKKFFKKTHKVESNKYNPVIEKSYQKIYHLLSQKGILLVAVQYPMRSIEQLKVMLEKKRDVIFVDNEKIFKNAVRQLGYSEYFIDNFAGNFGHCTAIGNELLAGNIAEVILKEYFNLVK